MGGDAVEPRQSLQDTRVLDLDRLHRLRQNDGAEVDVQVLGEWKNKFYYFLKGFGTPSIFKGGSDM